MTLKNSFAKMFSDDTPTVLFLSRLQPNSVILKVQKRITIQLCEYASNINFKVQVGITDERKSDLFYICYFCVHFSFK